MDAAAKVLFELQPHPLFPDLRDDSVMPEHLSDPMQLLFPAHARLRLGASSMKRGTEDGRSHR
jgi:hypothetical protein